MVVKHETTSSLWWNLNYFRQYRVYWFQYGGKVGTKPLRLRHLHKGQPPASTMSAQKYLTTYFSERDLPNRMIEVQESAPFKLHIIDVETVIRLIMTSPAREQEQVASMIRKIEWENPSAIHGFIDHLARCYIATHF